MAIPRKCTREGQYVVSRQPWPWLADTQGVRLHIYELEMLAVGFGIQGFIIILSIIPIQLLAWQSL